MSAAPVTEAHAARRKFAQRIFNSIADNDGNQDEAAQMLEDSEARAVEREKAARMALIAGMRRNFALRTKTNDATESGIAERDERISWLEQQREEECKQKNAALAESDLCLRERDQLRAEIASVLKIKDRACAAAIENKAEADTLRAECAELRGIGEDVQIEINKLDCTAKSPVTDDQAEAVAWLVSEVNKSDDLRTECERLWKAGTDTWSELRTHIDTLEASEASLRAELARYVDAVDAQPWATDEPIRVLLDRITAELATERARLAVMFDGFAVYSHLTKREEAFTSHENVSAVLDALKRAMDAAMKEAST